VIQVLVVIINDFAALNLPVNLLSRTRPFHLCIVRCFYQLGCEPRLCVLLSCSVRQRPSNLNASLRLVLGCRDSLAVCSAESDRVLWNPNGRTIVLAGMIERLVVSLPKSTLQRAVTNDDEPEIL
jgi:hypothetical protein